MASLLEGSERGFYEATAPALEPIAAVGSGDAFLAGFAAARFDGRPPQECLRLAVACGAESTQHFGAGTIDPAGGRTAGRAGRGEGAGRGHGGALTRAARGGGLPAVILGEALERGSDNAANSGISQFSPRLAGAFSSANERRVS